MRSTPAALLAFIGLLAPTVHAGAGPVEPVEAPRPAADGPSGAAWPASRENQRVADAIASALRAGGLGRSDIEIHVEAGGVRLLGRVDHHSAKELAVRIACGVRGVRSVENRIVVGPPGPGGGGRPVTPDPHVSLALAWDARVLRASEAAEHAARLAEARRRLSAAAGRSDLPPVGRGRAGTPVR